MKKTKRRLEVDELEPRTLLSCIPGAPDYNAADCYVEPIVKQNKISKVKVRQLTGDDTSGSFLVTVVVKGDPYKTAITELYCPGARTTPTDSYVINLNSRGIGEKAFATQTYSAGGDGTVKFSVKVKTANTVTSEQTVAVKPKIPKRSESGDGWYWDEEIFDFEV